MQELWRRRSSPILQPVKTVEASAQYSGFGSGAWISRTPEFGGSVKGGRTVEKAVYLIRAKARIEEANVQAVYRRETSAGAKFILQTEFGYADKEKIDPARLIEVKLVP